MKQPAQQVARDSIGPGPPERPDPMTSSSLWRLVTTPCGFGRKSRNQQGWNPTSGTARCNDGWSPSANLAPEHEHLGPSNLKLVVDVNHVDRPAFAAELIEQLIKVGVDHRTHRNEREDSKLVTGDSHEFENAGPMKLEIEAIRITEQEGRTQHEIKAVVLEWQVWKPAGDVALRAGLVVEGEAGACRTS